MTEEEIDRIIANRSCKDKTALEKTRKVCKSASESIGLKETGIADRYRFKIYLDELKRAFRELKDIARQVEKLLDLLLEAKILLSIKGIGKLSAEIFLGKLGDAKSFMDYRQVIKYAGYDPVRRDSGMRVGRRWISTKGRHLFRKLLYFMAMRVVHLSKYFREYYQRKKETKNRFGEQLKKKEALCAVVIKLIKVIFALLRDER